MKKNKRKASSEASEETTVNEIDAIFAVKNGGKNKAVDDIVVVKDNGETKRQKKKKQKQTKTAVVRKPTTQLDDIKHNKLMKNKASKGHFTAIEDEFADIRGTKHSKYTEDGLRIVNVAELKLDQGGDTALCPFDCDCCF